MIDAQARFSVIYEFVKGDLTQDIYRDLIHNENNMRPNQLNAMFTVAGLSDICSKVCDKPAMLTFFGETETGKAHGKLLESLEDFFDRRNGIAHALNSGQSSGSEQIITDLDMLQAFSEAMFQTLDALMLQRATVAAAASATDVELVLELGAVVSAAVEIFTAPIEAEPAATLLEAQLASALQSDALPQNPSVASEPDGAIASDVTDPALGQISQSNFD